MECNVSVTFQKIKRIRIIALVIPYSPITLVIFSKIFKENCERMNVISMETKQQGQELETTFFGQCGAWSRPKKFSRAGATFLPALQPWNKVFIFFYNLPAWIKKE